MYNCQVCQLLFDTKFKLASHFRWNHRPDKDFKCEKCSLVFKDKSCWANHVKYCKGLKEKKSLNKICTKCGYVIKRQYGM